MAILVTGGTGYIGSHTTVELIKRGEKVIIVDNLYNSKLCVLDRIETITGVRPDFIKCDLLDKEALDKVFCDHPDIDSVIHFAGLKAVGESVSLPLFYYHNNLTGTFNLLECMLAHKVYRIVFSSSATVYGLPKTVPIKEDFPLSCTNPYGQTKLMIEYILKDIAKADPEWDIALLRYFNPVGAHESGLIGEDPKGIPNNLMPYISQVAVGKREYVHVFGNDYDTPDGTGVRDYIHVLDLADGHLCALEKIKDNVGVVVYNLGTGHGYSVLDMIKAFSKACGKEIPYKIEDRRPGDIDACFANPEKAKNEIGFVAKHTLEEMCADTWKWQQMNPNGFAE